MPTIAAEELYRRLGRLIEEAPPFGGVSVLTTQQLVWVGRAEALLEASGDVTAQTEFGFAKIQIASPITREVGISSMMLSLYRVLGAAELASPPGAQGAFIPVGKSFDAYAAIAKVFFQASSDIFVIDPYMDDTVLLDFAGLVPTGVMLRLLSDGASTRPSLGRDEVESSIPPRQVGSQISARTRVA